MLEALAEAGAVAWPLAMTLATVALADRVRAGRRREALNGALHELRRPLQALVLARSAAGAGGADPQRRHLELALHALGELDRELNGRGAGGGRRPVDARVIAAEAVERWRGTAALAGRSVELAWHAQGAALRCDPRRLGSAIDNLIANALEHGSGRIRVEGTVRGARLRLVVADGLDAGSVPGSASATPRALVATPGRTWSGGGKRRRGYGLGIVSRTAAEHGGRFAICRHERGASAVLELPLAG